MPVNSMSVGVDYSFGYYDANSGSIVDLGDVQNVKITAQKHDISSKPYNGPPRYGFIPDGYRIDFTITRTGPTLEALMVVLEQRFSQGGEVKAGYLNQSVREPGGAITRFQYTGFVVFLPDHGEVSREKTVTLKLEGMASRKVPIA
jgi:hypothetical protein